MSHETPEPEIRTLGELRESGYRPRPVKQELRENLIRKLRAGEPVFRGLVGYDTTVVPQLINAILAQHDILLLGLRGQAKTRICRSLPELLDEWMPTVEGVELWDDPLEPRLSFTRRRIDQLGDDTPIRWVHRSQRYHEKLATPDVTIADLIGEVDLVKHAEGRYLADEETMHFGLIPRSNRGIFAINELPDLAPRIQVGLFNVLEERDVQIRGYPVRLPLDVMLVFSANPEDYTSRGRIVTPLKDRIGSVIRTHYPLSNEQAMQITRQQARLARGDGGPPVVVPKFVHEIVEELVRLARTSPHVNQQSGVSVRTSIAALEAVVANAEQRTVRLGEPAIVPRISDLAAVRAACRGKIELMLAESEDAEDKLLDALLGEAVRNVAEQYLEIATLEGVVAQFAGGRRQVETGDDLPADAILTSAAQIEGLRESARGVLEQTGEGASNPGVQAQLQAAAVEFVLEALHVHDKLSKYIFRERVFYKK